MNNIVDRIIYLLQEQNMSIKALEKEIGLGNGTIKNWNTSSPQCNKLMKVADYFDVSIEWLITGTAPNLSEDEQQLINEYRNAKPEVKESARLLLRAGRAEQEELSGFRTG